MSIDDFVTAWGDLSQSDRQDVLILIEQSDGHFVQLCCELFGLIGE